MAESVSVDRKMSKSAWRPGVWTLLSVCMIAFGAYYFVRIQQKTAYYAARNLRILSTLTRQVQDRIRTPEAAGEQALYWNGDRFDGRGKGIELSTLVKPVFDQSFVDVFDSVMVVDHEGRVRYRDPEGICNATSLDELTEVRNLTGGEVKLKKEDLQRRAQIARVILDGREYRLFSQPIPVRVGSANVKEQQWVVVGVVSSGRFTGESMAISYTLLIAVVAVFLLLLFSVPFLKLSLVGPLQRVRYSDILLLVISLVCATAVVTIILFDTLAYRRTRAYADAQLRHLASDIKRHVNAEIAQAYAVLEELEQQQLQPLPRPQRVDALPLPVTARGMAAVKTYPFFESYARIGKDGMQREKWLMDSNTLRLTGVADRPYFRAALQAQGWGKSGQSDRYTVDAIRSKTTGATEAVVAKRVAHPTNDDAVVAVAFPMLSLIDTVIAGGSQFVVIDDRGNVIFHSESQRNHAENFFDETDMSRPLRSAVAGRQNEMLNLRYWGEDRRAFATPIDGTPWTLVTFRSKRLLRTLNVETIMITVTFLLIYALAYLFFGAAVAIASPSYRAPWLWPDRRRAHVYTRMLLSYLAFAFCFGLSIYLYRPRVLLVLAATFPALAILLTYLRLSRKNAMSWVAAGAVLCALAVSFAYIIGGRVETDVMVPIRLLQLCLLLSGTLAVVLPLVPKTKWELAAEATAREKRNRNGQEGLAPPMPTRRYVAAAVGLLALSAVFPTAALYKAAYKIELESFVKHGQLQLVQDLEARLQRLSALQTEGWRSAHVYHRRRKASFGVYTDYFFQSRVLRLTPRSIVSKVYGLKPGDDLLEVLTRKEIARDEDPNPVPRVVEWLLPQYSDYSIRMRELLHSQSGDGRWTWRRDGAQLTFASESIFGNDLVVRSVVPRLLPRVLGEPQRVRLDLPLLVERDRPDRSDVAWPSDSTSMLGRWLLMLAAVVAYMFFILGGIWFVCRKVFLVDVRDPLWLDPEFRLSPALSGNMLIFCPDVETGLKRVERRQCIEVKLEQFAAENPETWRTVFTDIDRQPPSKGLLIPDFDLKKGADSAPLEHKLRFLERAMGVHGRRVIAITTTSPWVLLDAMSDDEKLAARWEALFAKFTVRVETPKADDDALARRPPFLPRPIDRRKLLAAVLTVPRRLREHPAAETRDVIRAETAHGDPFLQALGRELVNLEIGGREEAYDEILERAGAHYTTLWNGCSTAEKRVLSHLAADGFANEKDRHTLRRLIARNLICRDPNLRLMNESFRRFVLSEPCRRDLAECDTEVPVSAWDRIQRPLVVSLCMAAGFFFLTQRELFDASFAIVTAVAGGIPAILRVVGYFTETPGMAPTAR